MIFSVFIYIYFINLQSITGSKNLIGFRFRLIALVCRCFSGRLHLQVIVDTETVKSLLRLLENPIDIGLI